MKLFPGTNCQPQQLGRMPKQNKKINGEKYVCTLKNATEKICIKKTGDAFALHSAIHSRVLKTNIARANHKKKYAGTGWEFACHRSGWRTLRTLQFRVSRCDKDEETSSERARHVRTLRIVRLMRSPSDVA